MTMTDSKFTAAFLNQLRWRCRRGMQELDLLMLAYLEQYFESADPALQQAFLDILAMQDPYIFHLLTGRATSEDANVQAVIEVLLTLHSK